MMRAALLKLPEGERAFTDQLDNGAKIKATITIRRSDPRHSQGPNHATRNTQQAAVVQTSNSQPSISSPQPLASANVDFTGTDPVMPGNLNANRAIVMSALIYCFRCLIEEDIPLNSGVLAPIDVILPEGCLLNPASNPDPERCPAVVGGNVETSQRIVDVIFGALGVVAASQGTMNNFLFGRSGEKAFGYYETLCGGAGAGPRFDGADAVHTHMTNTRLTDPEVFEDRYPVRLVRTEIRSNSGGAGAHRGGDGITREIEFLEPVEVSLLTNRRTTSPSGLEGGDSGQSGRNQLKRAGSDTFEDLPPAAQFPAKPGDILRIETPGGGGFGK
jgi:5-oxoprolinase (ATP-hydrolysing)